MDTRAVVGQDLREDVSSKEGRAMVLININQPALLAWRRGGIP